MNSENSQVTYNFIKNYFFDLLWPALVCSIITIKNVERKCNPKFNAAFYFQQKYTKHCFRLEHWYSCCFFSLNLVKDMHLAWSGCDELTYWLIKMILLLAKCWRLWLPTRLSIMIISANVIIKTFYRTVTKLPIRQFSK